MFFVCISYYFVFFSTMFEENRKNVCVITCFCWQTLSASNTMAACYLLRSFKRQKGQPEGSTVMSIYVYFVLFRIAFRIFIPFYFDSYVFRMFFVFVRNPFVTYFVCVSYVFRKYFVFFSTIFEENRQNVCVITGFCWQTLSASNTMAACYLLRSFKSQEGQGSAVMSIYVYFV